jgi:hypothetical protein
MGEARPRSDPLPVLNLTDRVGDDRRQFGSMLLWRRRLLAAAGLVAVATVLLEKPDYTARRFTGIFASLFHLSRSSATSPEALFLWCAW